MSQQKPKYVTFRDLHAATLKPTENTDQSSPNTSSDNTSALPSQISAPLGQATADDNLISLLAPSTSSTTSIATVGTVTTPAKPLKDKGKTEKTNVQPSSTSSTSSAKSENQIYTDDEKPVIEDVSPTGRLAYLGETAPSRDFQRVPNSVVRHALPEGIFRGKSKQVWDYFWSVSRGSIIPVRQVRKSRREIQKGAGLGSMVTVDAAIVHLEEVGLIKVSQAVGSLQGNIYEVFTPEEVTPRYTSTTRYTRSTSLTQKLDILDIPESSISSITQLSDNTATYGSPKTFFKTDDEVDDDTHTFEQFFAVMSQVAKEVCGGVLYHSEQERTRWKELAEVLAEELRTAATRAGTISSPPAFLAAHLRRIFDKQRTNKKTVGKGDQRLQRSAPKTSVGIAEEFLPNKERLKTKFTFDKRRRYALNQQPPLGNGWIVESATGKYDEVIDAWLKEQSAARSEAALDASACPDCRGTGMYYPEGYEKGAAKCRHERLTAAQD